MNNAQKDTSCIKTNWSQAGPSKEMPVWKMKIYVYNANLNNHLLFFFVPERPAHHTTHLPCKDDSVSFLCINIFVRSRFCCRWPTTTTTTTTTKMRCQMFGAKPHISVLHFIVNDTTRTPSARRTGATIEEGLNIATAVNPFMLVTKQLNWNIQIQLYSLNDYLSLDYLERQLEQCEAAAKGFVFCNSHRFFLFTFRFCLCNLIA